MQSERMSVVRTGVHNVSELLLCELDNYSFQMVLLKVSLMRLTNPGLMKTLQLLSLSILAPVE